MTEILLFIVEESEEGGYTRARGGRVDRLTEADTLEELREMVRDAVRCHFDEDDAARPKAIRLHLVHDEVIAA